MKVELGYSVVSSVVTMSHCPRAQKYECGVLYRDL